MKQEAINLIKTYVLRGDTLKDLGKSFLGSFYKDFGIKITKINYDTGKRFSEPMIVVKKGDKKEIFKLEDIYNEIKKL